ncbi:hypothetical protein J4217_00065 [Candidatus Pacearchaeota archaeon]|nr:hypothetical protein [Candidatus Pacearchaeota archaeon]
MAVNIHKLIAAINPDLYCDNEVDEMGVSAKEKVEKMLEEERKAGNKHPYLAAAKEAKLRVGEWMDIKEIDIDRNTMDYKKIFANGVEKHLLVYDAFGESLEPIYFWLLDLMNSFFKGSTEKIVDNFSSSVSSSFFAEMGQRATRMQEESMKILGTLNTVIKSVLNILYDLKEFRIRLETYVESHSQDNAKRNAAFLALKQIWLDQVDMKKGTTAIKAMAQQFDYVTLIDAFMATSSLNDITKPVEQGGLDLNERVKRLLQQRYGEFERWLSESEKELTKRFEIEKNYLKGQMASLRMYSKWIKPYLKAAAQLENNEMSSSALVSAFNTLILELAVLGKGEYKPIDDVKTGDLPTIYKKLVENGRIRKYSPVMITEFRFRSAPERMQQGGYGFRGRAEVEFTSYALTDDEMKIIKAELEEDELGDTLKLIQESTQESIEAIEKDIKEFLEDKKSEIKKDEEKIDEEDSNPFSSLFSFLKSDKSKKSAVSVEKKETDFEMVVRANALISARKICRKIYDIYKKAHSMPTFPGS